MGILSGFPPCTEKKSLGEYLPVCYKSVANVRNILYLSEILGWVFIAIVCSFADVGTEFFFVF